MRSLRRSLIVTLLAAVAAVTLAAALFVYRLARREIDAIFDYDLRQLALTLREQVSSRGEVGIAAGGELEFAIQIWALDGRRLFASRPDSGLPQGAALGYATVQAPTGAWRVYAAPVAGLVVQVAQPLRVRQELAVAAALRTLAPVLLILPLLGLLAWRIVGRALAPLNRLARDVASRNPAALEPIREAGAPEEAVPLVRALNDLLVRLGGALSSQRAFVADAAHELRTPLAALELQVQQVEGAAGAAERAAALAELRAGQGRLTRVVQQLLTLARAEPDAGEALERQPVSLSELAGQVIADHALLAEAKGIDLGASRAPEDAVVVGDPAALRSLLANLVDNALRYAPGGGRVDADAGVEAGRPFLEVSDHGPGIPEAERERVFDRFYRRAGAAATGTGLGLAIVKAIAERHQARVALSETPGGGLTVRVAFPPPPPPPGEEGKPGGEVKPVRVEPARPNEVGRP